jgi:hypothetical protein
MRCCLQEVPADDISEQHTALLDKVKRMLAATGAEQNIQGAGPVRQQQQHCNTVALQHGSTASHMWSL